MPLLRSAAPASTGTILQSIVALRSAALSCASSSGCPSRYAEAIASSTSATASIIFSRAAATSSAIAAGMSSSRGASVSSPEKYSARCRIRSTTPANLSSAPIGSCSGTGFAPSRSRISVTAAAKSRRRGPSC